MAIRQIGASQSTDPMQMLFLMMQMEENRADRRREERKFDLQMEQMKQQIGAQNKQNQLLEFQTLLKGIQDDESLSDDERKSAMQQLYSKYGFNFPKSGTGKEKTDSDKTIFAGKTGDVESVMRKVMGAVASTAKDFAKDPLGQSNKFWDQVRQGMTPGDAENISVEDLAASMGVEPEVLTEYEEYPIDIPEVKKPTSTSLPLDIGTGIETMVDL